MLGASLERAAGTNGCGRYGRTSRLKIDTGKWHCTAGVALSITFAEGTAVCL